MTRDEVIRIAHLTGVLDDRHYGSVWTDRLVEFANAAVIANAAKEIQIDYSQMANNFAAGINRYSENSTIDQLIFAKLSNNL